MARGLTLSRGLDALAEHITAGVGTVRGALALTALSLWALPGDPFANWVDQVLVPLVLVSVLMVGQKRQTAATEALIHETHDVVLAELAELRALHSERTPA